MSKNIYLELADYKEGNSVFAEGDYGDNRVIMRPDIREETTVEQYTGTSTVSFTFIPSSRTYVSYIRQPVTLLHAFSRIGGLLAFFKISALLLWCHRKAFERRLQAEFSRKIEPTLQREDSVLIT